MNLFAIPTLKSVRTCRRLPISMIPRRALNVTLARLRTGMDRLGSWLRSAAVTTVSATPTSFWRTAPDFVRLRRAMLAHRLPSRRPGPRAVRVAARPGAGRWPAGEGGALAGPRAGAGRLAPAPVTRAGLSPAVGRAGRDGEAGSLATGRGARRAAVRAGVSALSSRVGRARG